MIQSAGGTKDNEKALQTGRKLIGRILALHEMARKDVIIPF